MMQNYIVDQGLLGQPQRYQPFALTDLLIEYAGKEQVSFLHFWQLKQTMILGMKDTRVPYLKAGLDVLIQHGYQPIVRNSGGLGVIADSGILNISLIIPNSAAHKWSIDDGYTQLFQLTKQALAQLPPIEAHEIVDSYCPGSFDLSIDGKKIAGIAQRRVKDGMAVMMYLSVTGNQHKRGEAVRTFYQKGLKEAFGQQGYPAVNPDSMIALDQVDNSMTINKVKSLFTLAYQKSNTTQVLLETTLLENPEHLTIYQKKLLGMEKRNQIIQEVLHDNTL